MTPNEPQILKDAIAYLQASSLMKGNFIVPDSQDFQPDSFPCVAVSVRTVPVKTGITETLLSETVVQASVYAETLMEVLDILVSIDVIMENRGYKRTNNTNPYCASSIGKWVKMAWYSKKTNTF